MQINYLNGCLYRTSQFWNSFKFSQYVSLSLSDKGRTHLRLLTIAQIKLLWQLNLNLH